MATLKHKIIGGLNPLSIENKEIMEHFINEMVQVNDDFYQKSLPCYEEKYDKKTYCVKSDIGLQVSYNRRDYLHKLNVGMKVFKFLNPYPLLIKEMNIFKKFEYNKKGYTIQIFIYPHYERGFIDYIVFSSDGKETKKEKFFSKKIMVNALIFDIIRDVESNGII